MPPLDEVLKRAFYMASKRINYEELVQQALIHVVRDLLKDAATKGLPANHHFYVTYNTDHPGVEMPDYLREQYPESITIVIQYEFWDLVVEENHFEVTLSFNNLHEKLVVPFGAMTSFVDPSAKFGLQFTPSYDQGAELKSFTRQTAKGEKTKAKQKFEVPTEAIEGNVISFDAFRKKK